MIEQKTALADNVAVFSVEGTAQASRQISGQNVGYFVVHFVDAGEPGRADRFAIALLRIIQ